MLQGNRQETTFQFAFRDVGHLRFVLHRWDPELEFVTFQLLRIKRPQYNRFTHNYDICTNAIGLLLVPFAVTWVIGAIYNKVQFESATQIPVKNSIMTAGTVVAGALFSILAIQSTSFTVVIMFESCSILPVVFIGVFCSRVHDPNLKLGPKKIITAFVIAGGILMFQFADPETKNREAKQNILGIVFLLFHFVA